MKKEIFKAYDIRGIYGTELDEDSAYKIGRAFVVFLRCRSVVVGYDMRKSSPKLFKSLSKGITDQGADVIEIGMCTTPMLNFAVANYSFDAGIMISASHNPSEYNAFKLIKKPVLQISSDSGMQDIQNLVEKNNFKEISKKGKILKKDVLEDYIAHITRIIGSVKGTKIIVDYGNGVGSISAKPIFKKLGLYPIELYAEPDGNFPNHPANPHELKNFKDLQKNVKSEKADLGVFFDGDADRSIIVDEKGEIILADLLLCLLAEDELKKHPNKKVYYDLRFSKIAKDVIEKNKGIPIMMKVGNPFYKERLVKEKGLLAGEFSGHMMFYENFCIDDGLFAALKVISIVKKSKKPISKLIEPYKRYDNTPEINIDVKGKNTDDILAKVKSAFKDGKSIELDGVYIQYSDWWFSLRKSNTEPLVRLRIEADSKELLDKKKKEILDIIKN